MRYCELSRKKLIFIVTPDELRAVVKNFHHVVVNTGVSKSYTESDPNEFFEAYEKMYLKLKSGEKLTGGADVFLSVGITAHPENCIYKPTSKLSVPDFAEPCPTIETFCILPYRGTLSTSFSVLQYPENTCGLSLSFPAKVEYDVPTDKHPSGIVMQGELDDFKTYEALVSRIKSITKPLGLIYGEKVHRLSVRISAAAKRDIEKFYFLNANGIEVD